MSNVFHNGKEYKAVSRKAVVGDLVQITGDSFTHDPHGLAAGTIDKVIKMQNRVDHEEDFVLLMAEASWGEQIPDRVRLEENMTNAPHEDYVVLEEVGSVDTDEFNPTDKEPKSNNIPKELIGRKVRVLEDNPHLSTLKKGEVVTVSEPDSFAQSLGIETIVKRASGQTFAVGMDDVELVEEDPAEISEGTVGEVSSDDSKDVIGNNEIPVEWIGRKARVTEDNPSESPLKKGDIVTVIKAEGIFTLFGLETMVQRHGDERPYTVYVGAVELLDENGNVQLKAGDMVRLLQDDTDWRSFQAGDEVELFEYDGHIVFEDGDGDTRLLEAFKYERI